MSPAEITIGTLVAVVLLALVLKHMSPGAVSPRLNYARGPE